MGQPGGKARYDADVLKGVQADTEELRAAFGQMARYAREGESSAAAFGKIGEETNVGKRYDEVRDALSGSLVKAGDHANKLGDGVGASLKEQHGRDEQGKQEFRKANGEK